MGYYDLPLKERRKEFDRILHNVEEHNKLIQNRLTLDNPALIERYISGGLEVHLHLSVGGMREGGEKFNGVKSQEFAAVLWHEHSVLDESANQLICVNRSSEVGRIKDVYVTNDFIETHNGYYQKSVFVLDVKLIENPQFFPLSSLARFQLFDEVYDFWRKQLYFSLTDGKFKFLGTLSDGKVDMGRNTVVTSVNEFDKLTGEQVERGSKIMDGITDHATDIGRRWLDSFGIERCLLGIGVYILDNGIRIKLDKDILGLVKIRDVLFGPFNLRPDTKQRIISRDHVLNSPYSRGNMNDKNKPTQKTKTGHEIPVPTKEDFMRDLEKASEPVAEKKPSRPARRPKKSRKKR